MIEFDFEKLLGSSAPDPGCDDSGELMDEYCELVLRGDAVPDRYTAFLTHMTNCAACREDMESLLAVLRQGEKTGRG
ncbi:MAG: hypothetical protein DMD63_05230 [Gemmatimonadetes bacterium]|nr:MAG: hypothetical protein DMD63_05230 [Gemmatimonadota bacterium]